MLTIHGGKRAAKHSGVGKKGADALAEDARANGQPREDTKGNLRRYLDSQWFKHTHAFMVVHNGFVFVFKSKKDGPLITMYSLPGGLRHKKAARAA